MLRPMPLGPDTPAAPSLSRTPTPRLSISGLAAPGTPSRSTTRASTTLLPASGSPMAPTSKGSLPSGSAATSSLPKSYLPEEIDQEAGSLRAPSGLARRRPARARARATRRAARSRCPSPGRGLAHAARRLHSPRPLTPPAARPVSLDVADATGRASVASVVLAPRPASAEQLRQGASLLARHDALLRVDWTDALAHHRCPPPAVRRWAAARDRRSPCLRAPAFPSLHLDLYRRPGRA